MSKNRPLMTVDPRERIGSRHAARLRKTGKLPAVIYGHNQSPEHVAVSHDELNKHLDQGTHLIDLQMAGGSTQTCLIKDIQFDYLGTRLIHVDLARVDLSEEVTVSVPIEIKGKDQNQALKSAGTIMEELLRDLDITCRADSIPDSILVDISGVELNSEFRVNQLQLPAGVRCELKPTTVIVSIHEVVEQVEEAPADGAAAAAEPEVITAKKEEKADDKKDAKK